MADALVSPHLADLALGLLALEGALLLWWRGRARAGVLLLGLLPGGFLLLALRMALAGAAWPWTPVFLALALPAHLLDLRRRV